MPLQRISDLTAGTPPYNGAGLIEVSVPTGSSPPYVSRKVQLSDALSGVTLPVTSGGTGATTLPPPSLAPAVAGITGSILLGNGTGAVAAHDVWGRFGPGDFGLRGYIADAINPAHVSLARALGTPGAAAVIVSTTWLGYLDFEGWNGSAWVIGGDIRFEAAENWSGTASGSRAVIRTNTLGTQTHVDRLTIQAGVQVGAPAGGDKGAGTLNAATGLYVANVPVLTASGISGMVAGQIPVAASATTITSSIANGQLPATATNDNAAAGKVGEYISSTVLGASAVSLTNSTPANITSISLTAGDWDVVGFISFTAGATNNITVLQAWVNTTSATAPDQALRWQANAPTGGMGGVISASPPPLRVSASGTTTVYLSCNQLFAASTATGCGTIRARRIR